MTLVIAHDPLFPMVPRALLARMLAEPGQDFSVVRENRVPGGRTGCDVPLINADMTESLGWLWHRSALTNSLSVAQLAELLSAPPGPSRLTAGRRHTRDPGEAWKDRYVRAIPSRKPVW